MRGSSAGLALALGTGLAAAALLVTATLFFVGAVFAAPHWLHLAWLAPALLVFEVLAARARRRAAGRLGEPAAVERLVQHRVRARRPLRAMLASVAVLLLAVACARPQWGMAQEQLERRGVDVVLCVDTSKSMSAEDVKPSRLGRARIAVDSLLERLRGDRVSIIAHAGEARILCPLTLDHAAARLFLDTLDVELLQRPGTAIGSALRLADQTLEGQEGRHAVVVLLTDGEDHAGEAVEAARELASKGVVVHAIGFGRTEGVPIPIEEETPSGERTVGFLRDARGEAVMTKLDAAALEAIAEAGNGSFYQASSSEREVAAIAQEISRMEQQEYAGRRTRLRTDRYAWFLVPALLLMVAEAFLPEGAPLRRRSEVRTTRVAAVARRAAARRSRDGRRAQGAPAPARNGSGRASVSAWRRRTS